MVGPLRTKGVKGLKGSLGSPKSPRTWGEAASILTLLQKPKKVNPFKKDSK